MTERALQGACALAVALLAAPSAIAEEGGATVLLDLRPVRVGARGTNLDLLAEAAVVTKELREAIAGAGQRSMDADELKVLLGPTYRVQLFACNESLGCLRPIVAKLARSGERVIVLGTIELDAESASIELSRIEFRPYRIDKTLTVRLPGRSAPPPEDLWRRLAPLIEGGARSQAPPVVATPPPTSTPSPAPTGDEAAHASPPPAAAPPDDGADLVESIGDATSPPPPPSPPPPDRFQLNGWARLALDVGFSHQAAHDKAPDPLALPYDRLALGTQLYLRGRYAHGRWFEAVASGLLSYSLLEQGPADPTATFNGFNGQSSRSVFEPSLRELYIGFFTKRLDVRIGQQRVAWGRADLFSPNDIVNARDLRDPVLAEVEVLHIPTPILRGDLDIGIGILELVVAPFFVPDRFDVYGSNWAALQPDAPAPYRGFLNLTSRLVDPTLQEALQPLLAQTALPRFDLRSTSAGARFSWTVKKLDVSHYYHYGYDGTPLLVVNPQFAQLLSMIDFSSAKLADLQPVLQSIDAGVQPFTATYVRRHHVGIDAVTTAGPFAFRLDAAYESNRVFYRRDLTGVSGQSFQAVASVEYQTGDVGKTVLLEGSYLRVIDDLGPLMFYDRDSGGIAAVARWSFFQRVKLELEGRAFVGIRPFSYVARPQVAIKWRALAVRLGAVVLGGDDYSLGGYFHRNVSAYVIVKYGF